MFAKHRNISYIILSKVIDKKTALESFIRGETKKQRFIRVVEKRVQNVLDSIRKLSQCSNGRMYEWDDEQLKKIWHAIDTELKNCEASFNTTKPELFKLKEH